MSKKRKFKNSWQQQVHDWITKQDIPYWDVKDIMLHLQEEGGELAREINHEFGPKQKKATEAPSSKEAEVGDMLFTLTCFCNSQNIDIDKAFGLAIQKCYGRDKDRFKKKKQPACRRDNCENCEKV